MKSYINRDGFKRLLVVAHIFVACFATAEQKQTIEQDFFKEPLTQYTKPCWHNPGRENRGIEFFKDAQGNNFVLKHQITGSAAIHDVLGARIGNSVDVPVNQAILLAKGTLFMGKPLETMATLHTHVPGREIKKIEKMPFHVDIRDGLSQEENLNSIAQSKDLARIVALILYTNNNDAHLSNIFFAQETNRFYAIDQGNIFRHAHSLFERKTLPSDLLATKACSFVETLRAKKLSPEQIKALQRVDETLDKFITAYPADKIYDEWMSIAQQARYAYSPERKNYIKRLVDYNCDEVNTLRSHLDCAIAAQKRSYTLRSMAEPSNKAQRDFWHNINS